MSGIFDIAAMRVAHVLISVKTEAGDGKSLSHERHWGSYLEPRRSDVNWSTGDDAREVLIHSELLM
jgi:hypothetical protein